ncbi:MAG: fatty acid hydroxylase family protein [Pseudomonadales bacterium]|nr:sterol desaturase family protein [Pseudomonadales bacterium]RZV55317.1 MAG: fatty acid hydroxylase family protein [Pseudomonadales bacterium]
MIDYKPIILALFAGFHIAEIIAGKFWAKGKVRKDDVYIEVIGTAFYVFIAAPFIFYGAPVVVEYFFPGSENAWAHFSWWQMLAVLLVADEMLHYWWHRACHEIPWMYPLHSAHHSCHYMSVRLAFRNNIFFFLLMPNMWAAAALLHLGFGPVYAIYIIVKMTVNFCSHSPLRWDKYVYRVKWLSPIMWVFERIITTPSAHSAHHGLCKDDGVTNYKGNYGNLFFFWDVLFGTAKITRRYPEEYGIENRTPRSWRDELFWPVLRDKVEGEVRGELQSPPADSGGRLST